MAGYRRALGRNGLAHDPALVTNMPTIRQPMYEIGTRLCRMLIQVIKGEEPEEKQVVLPPALVVRESCGTHHHTLRR